MTPGKTLPLLLAGGAIVIGAGYAGWRYMGAATPPPSAASSSAAPVEQDCNKYIRCKAMQVIRDASARCKEPIEQLAAFSSQWKEPGADTIFHDYVWLDQGKGTITFLGNKVQFQNAGGANMPVAYECDFDPATGIVLDARARVGAPG